MMVISHYQSLKSKRKFRFVAEGLKRLRINIKIVT